jgi:hypothetical protein
VEHAIIIIHYSWAVGLETVKKDLYLFPSVAQCKTYHRRFAPYAHVRQWGSPAVLRVILEGEEDASKRSSNKRSEDKQVSAFCSTALPYQTDPSYGVIACQCPTNAGFKGSAGSSNNHQTDSWLHKFSTKSSTWSNQRQFNGGSFELKLYSRSHNHRQPSWIAAWCSSSSSFLRPSLLLVSVVECLGILATS